MYETSYVHHEKSRLKVVQEVEEHSKLNYENFVRLKINNMPRESSKATKK